MYVHNSICISFSHCHRTLHGVDTNGLVQKALNASNVHENIINYINEANQMSILALNTTERVNDVSNNVTYLNQYAVILVSSVGGKILHDF